MYDGGQWSDCGDSGPLVVFFLISESTDDVFRHECVGRWGTMATVMEGGRGGVVGDGILQVKEERNM